MCLALHTDMCKYVIQHTRYLVLTPQLGVSGGVQLFLHYL
jgi:hypothetical protein